MLRKNPLQPPRPFSAAGEVPSSGTDVGPGPGFLAAEDFDKTGVLSGVDPSEPRYWWIPELYGPIDRHADHVSGACRTHAARQATRRAAARTVAAA